MNQKLDDKKLGVCHCFLTVESHDHHCHILGMIKSYFLSHGLGTVLNMNEENPSNSLRWNQLFLDDFVFRKKKFGES